MSFYSLVFKQFFSKIDAEWIHDFALSALGIAGKIPSGLSLIDKLFTFRDKRLEVDLFDLKFPNPIGLAGGFDKNAVASPALSRLGFGFIETGTVTPLPQPGNSQPRIFRLIEDQAIINRCGFPNAGSAVVADHLRKVKSKVQGVLGASLGKGIRTALDDAAQDYQQCIQALYDCTDFLVLNVSSPNTPGLRSLQKKDPLTRILRELVAFNRQTASNLGCSEKPLLVKIAPDMSPEELDSALEAILESKISGVVATNTSLQREGLNGKYRNNEGGLSGLPIRALSTGIIQRIHTETKGTLPIIGSGGIFTAVDALEKLAAGASLLQAYTGFIFQGPFFAKAINRGLLRYMDSSGIDKITDLVGNQDLFDRIQSNRDEVAKICLEENDTPT